MFIFVFAENATKGKPIVVKLVRLEAISNVIERRKNDIVTKKRENRSTERLKNDDDGGSGKKPKKITITININITTITTTTVGVKKGRGIGKTRPEIHLLAILTIMHYQKNNRTEKTDFAISVVTKEL